ncbi:MAG: hypothetical protein WCI11_11215 [Candidatus Methylumidiphilus sp.]
MALEAIAAQQGILDTRSALRKFRAQMDALAVHVSFWWLWVGEILAGWPVDTAHSGLSDSDLQRRLEWGGWMVPEMEYFFADTGAELPETMAFVDLLQDYLGKPIERLQRF